MCAYGMELNILLHTQSGCVVLSKYIHGVTNIRDKRTLDGSNEGVSITLAAYHLQVARFRCASLLSHPAQSP